MSYISVSHWDCTEWNDEMEAIAREKYIPMIMAMGAQSVDMVRTGDLEFLVVTRYTDQAASDAAQARVAEIRGQAADEFPMKMASVQRGPVFAGG